MTRTYHLVGAYPAPENTHEPPTVSDDSQEAETVNLLDGLASRDRDLRAGSDNSSSTAGRPTSPVVHHVALLEK